MEKETRRITIDQVAEALGVSKTTVSRAISGKGRIGEATRQRVLEYIEKCDYTPSIIARGLAQSKTFNIGVVMPEDYQLSDLSFFQRALVGIQQFAGERDYDILLCISKEEDCGDLIRILTNQKVDGVILLRTYRKDRQIEVLQEKGIPFVAVGDTDYPGVYQVDHDQRTACCELTGHLLSRFSSRIALMGGRESLMITRKRLEGFCDAYRESKKTLSENLIYLNLESKLAADQAVETVLDKQVDGLICMDDVICNWVVQKLRQEQKMIPEDVWVASFYNSWVLENMLPAITAISFDAKELGKEACRKLFHLLNEEEVPQRTILPYRVVLEKSTGEGFPET